MRRRVAAAVLCCALSVNALARDRSTALGWDELGAAVNGKTFYTVLQDGTRVDGRAIAVQPEGLRTTVRKSTNSAYAKSKEVVLPRESLSAIQVQHRGWKWKVLIPIAGFFAGAVIGGLIGTAADHKSCFIICDGTAIGVLVGGAGGVGLGLWAGHQADRQYTTITIKR
jgi:hypothetical protein